MFLEGMKKTTFLEYLKYLNDFFDIIFPPKCIFCCCVMPIRTKVCICERCLEDAPFIKGKVCMQCGQPIENTTHNDKCLDCRGHTHEYVQGISVLEYKDKVKHAIVMLKFYGKKKYADTLGIIMADKIKKIPDWPRFGLVVYTPLHKKRYAERGYNQAQLIAKTIARELGITLGDDVLVKTRQTKSQNKLTRIQRLINIKNAFEVNNKALVLVRDARVLLIDDVYTTGTTVDECARTLKRAGAHDVFVVTVAIGKGMT
jgi:ComF family protein